ncbi:MAG: intradiol ring-cleavage dioxygenase [Chloroflexaceae bacterium]|jgi:protocatechuate 3,4-dioxygenase beta subunit|nr:intradiol ring-cleavage dioxygenase [Chloroflexaceae bacterium]
MDNDDRPIGRVLSRREVLALLGSSAAAVLAGCAAGANVPVATPAASVSTAATAVSLEAASAAAMQANPTLAATAEAQVATAAVANTSVAASGAVPACVVRPEQAEGPYFVDDKLNRADIRADPASGSVKQGTPLLLTFNVSQVGSGGCAPLSGATVDIWHCDAAGVYSDVQDPSFNTVGQQWLRGYQTTDANGSASFTTIYPGWYPGRTVHIHFKIRATDAAGQVYDFTSQLYFDDGVTDTVFAQAPYNSRGQRSVRNEGDGIYRRGGSQLLVTPTATAQGYAATFDIGVQL